MSLLDLFATFLQPIFDLVPRVARRPASNEWMIVDGLIRGVRIGYRPLLHCPAVCHVVYFPSCEIPIDCGIQRVTTADGCSIVINATCRIIIADPILARDKVDEQYEEAAAMIARSHICDLASGHNFSHVIELVQESVCTEAISDDLAEMGMELIAFKVEDLQRVIPIGSV